MEVIYPPGGGLDLGVLRKGEKSLLMTSQKINNMFSTNYIVPSVSIVRLW